MNTRYDMPENLYFGSGGGTLLTPLALAILVMAGVLISVLPRKYAIVPLLMAGLLLPPGNMVVVFGFHFYALRLLLLAGWIRLLIRRDLHSSPMNSLDKVVLFWAVCNAIAFSLLWGESAAVINRIGFLYTTLGTYFLLRFLIRDKEDVVRTIKALALVITIIAPLMLTEHVTGHNGFSTIGAKELSEVRYGKIRAQGPFAHSIIAGVVGAMLLPLFVGLWWQGRHHRLIAGLGVISATVMMITSASSTPVMTYVAGICGLLLWPARKHLRMVRWGLVIVIVGLNVVMKAPVWFLIAHVGALMGGTGWHRAVLIDTFVRHFGEWWLIGTRNNADWGYDMWDAVNAYVGAGQGGGLLTFILFIAVLVYAYKRIGVARRLAEKSSREAHLIWAIGAALFANTVAFFGETYYDQSVIAWYALIVMISVTPFVADTKPTRPEFEMVYPPAEQVSFRTAPEEVAESESSKPVASRLT